jgi:hypothetical protein
MNNKKFEFLFENVQSSNPCADRWLIISKVIMEILSTDV